MSRRQILWARTQVAIARSLDRKAPERIEQLAATPLPPRAHPAAWICGICGNDNSSNPDREPCRGCGAWK